MGHLDDAGRETLAASVTYTGSALHKRHPGDYGYQPPVNPRPWKSLCDEKRVILIAEASDLLRTGIRRGMVSPFTDGGAPKYIWSVDQGGDVYEAKIDNYDARSYHGYRLGEDDTFRNLVLKEWEKRCPR